MNQIVQNNLRADMQEPDKVGGIRDDPNLSADKVKSIGTEKNHQKVQNETQKAKKDKFEEGGSNTAGGSGR